MKYGKHLVAVSALVVVATVVVYLLLSAIYQLPIPASAEAEGIDALMDAHFILISFLWSLVVVFVLYSLVVFRRRADDDGSEGDHFHGHTGLEIAWTILPLALVVYFGVWGAQLLNEVTAEEENELVVHVIGQQWAWSFEYPEYDNLRTSEMWLPVDRPVRLEMESLDVLHSFWVPEFRVKQDLLPGVVKPLRFTPVEEGEYKVRCAEICGTAHATMLAPVNVVPAAEFESWAEEQLTAALPEDPAERGAVWYETYGCNACHSLEEGVELVGPSWHGLYLSERPLAEGGTVAADEAYLESSILNPNEQIVEGYQPNLMPQNFAERFAEDEATLPGDISIIEDLIAFIKTLE